MTFLNAIMMKNRNNAMKRDETEKPSTFEIEDGFSETDHYTCSSRTDEPDLILFAETSVCSGPAVEERSRVDVRLKGSTQIRDPAVCSRSPSSQEKNPSPQTVSMVQSFSREKAYDLSECDVSISNPQVVEEASPGDRVVYGYGDAVSNEDLGAGTRTRSASMPLNETAIPVVHSNMDVTPGRKAWRSTSLSHKQAKSSIRANKGSFGPPRMRGSRTLSSRNVTRQPPIGSLFSGANSPRRPLSPQHVTKPLARVAAYNSSHDKVMSPKRFNQCLGSTEMENPIAPLKYEPICDKAPSSKSILLGSNGTNSFGCISIDESDDSDDDLIIETEEENVSSRRIMTTFQSGVDSSEHSYTEARRLLSTDDELSSPRDGSRSRSPRHVERSTSGDLGKQQEIATATRLAEAKMLLGIVDMNASFREDKSPRSPRRVVRGKGGFFVLQEETQSTGRICSAKLLVDRDDAQATIGCHDLLSRSDHTHRRRSKMDPLSRSEHTLSASRPRLLKTESAHLMYTKHEDLLAVYENIIGAEDIEGAHARLQNVAPGATKQVASSVRPTSRRLGLEKAQSARYPRAHEDGTLSVITKAARQNELSADQEGCFASPSRSRSLMSNALQSPFNKSTSHKSRNQKERRKIPTFDSPNRSSSLLSSWKRISPTRESSGLARMSPLPILQGLAGRIVPKKNIEEGELATHNKPHEDDDAAVGAVTRHDNAHTKLSKGYVHNNDSTKLTMRDSLSVPQRSQSMYSNVKVSVAEQKSSEGNCSARMSLPTIKPLPGIPQEKIPGRRSVGLQKATSLRTVPSQSIGDTLGHLFDKYSAIVESPSVTDVSGRK